MRFKTNKNPDGSTSSPQNDLHVYAKRGGVEKHLVVVSDDMFAADAMVGDAVDFEEMKVKELKDELMARSASRTGVKGVLQQRLHTLIVKAAAEAARARADSEF